jgi:hypothetical protein
VVIVNKVIDGQVVRVDERTAERKVLSPVDVANAEIERRMKTLGKKP